LGYAHLEEHTRTISDFLDTWSLQTLEGDPVPVEEWPLMRALRGEMFTDYELVARRHDESHACVLSHAGTAIRSDSGEIVRAIVTYRDITGLVEARRSLSLANEQLVEADRRKNEFMAILSHELRNPLTPIKNSLYILDRATPGGAQERRAKETIARQVNQLVRLVDDLLDLTRITRGKVALQRQHLELNALVRKTLDDHNTVFENSHIELSFEPASHSVWVDADYNRLAQIVGNLLQNSAKFTPAGGRVTARVFGDETLQQAEIQISDTGVGIDAHMLQRLFEPFMQADNTIDRTRGGLGLGLALVKTLAELHGGCVEVESAGLGLGTTFTVRFPKLHDVTRPPPSSEQQLAGTASERVLIIEDNVDAADSLCMLLQLEGYNVVVTYDGPSGLAKALTWRPAVILCDIGLPGMDGYAIARAIRRDATLEATRLVALSGYSRPEDVRCARDAGFDQHMSKPPNFEQLRALLAARNSCP
jgi:signal transduction histidine kinase/ActR/RegA family two-component response regulator